MDVNCPKGGRHEVEQYWHEGHPFRCHKCHMNIGMKRVAALANAAMQLTAGEAETDAATIEGESYDCPELRAYIKAWPK